SPAVDADGDGFSNSDEYIAGTVPTNAASLLRIDQVTQAAGSATVTCRTVPGKRYQLLSRTLVQSGTWQAVGIPVQAIAATTALVDPGVTGARFYRVQVLP